MIRVTLTGSPKNGKEKSKMTWISHAAVSEEIFASNKFKAKTYVSSPTAFLRQALQAPGDDRFSL